MSSARFLKFPKYFIQGVSKVCGLHKLAHHAYYTFDRESEDFGRLINISTIARVWKPLRCALEIPHPLVAIFSSLDIRL